ncbi:MAG: AraC family transcriptional regulator ligand-binding domain-containing protein [Myxococcales bacterium]|nr:AraC family transcriptional regulator ligand-binding domain-containing protein [Myxococcales bacterium]
MLRLNDEQISAVALSSLLRPTLEMGIPLDRLFTRFGFQPDLSRIEQTAVDLRFLDAFVVALVAEAGPRRVGTTLGAGFAFDYLPELDVFLATAPTLRDGFETYTWLRRLVAPFLRVRLDGGEHGIHLIVEPVAAFSALTSLVYAEAVLAASAKFVRRIANEPVPYREVTFRHRPPGERAEYDALFRAPVRFGARYDGFVFSASVLDQPLRGALPDLHAQAIGRLEARAAAVAPPPGLVDRIEHALKEEPALLTESIEVVASRLHVTPRTLQRRLTEGATSFRAVQDRVRRDLALAWMNETEWTIDEIAERLGFSERRSFARAFRRWTGRGPGAWRRERR